MSVLEQVYSQGGDVILHTFEITSESWAVPIILVRDYQDHSITTEDDRILLARGVALDLALPKRDASGAQDITVAFDGVRPEATRLLRQAQDAGVSVRMTYRCYLYSDLSEPAEQPLYMIVRRFSAKADHVEVTAGLFDFIDMRWPRVLYNSNNTPGLKYYQ